MAKLFFLNPAFNLLAASLRRTLVRQQLKASFIMQLKNSCLSIISFFFIQFKKGGLSTNKKLYFKVCKYLVVGYTTHVPASVVGPTTQNLKQHPIATGFKIHPHKIQQNRVGFYFKYAIILLLTCSPFFVAAQSPVLSLKEAISIAMKNNFDVVITKNETDIGKINNNWGNAGALPVISATTNRTLATNNIEQELANGTTNKRNGASVNNFNAGVAVNWQFFDGMRMFATKKRLEELEKIGEINFTKMVNETVFNLITAYYNIVRLNQQALAVKEVIGLYQERLKIAETRFNIGSSAKPDLLQAKVDLNEQETELLIIDNSIVIGKTNLNNILARDPSTAFEIIDSFSLSKPIDLGGIQQKIETQNPDVLLAKSNLAVLMQTKKEINANRLPSAALNGNYNFIKNKSGGGFILLNQAYGPSATLGINIPIFRGGVVKQQLKVADINIKNQQIAAAQLRNQLQGTLINSYANYNNGLKLVTMEQENLIIVKENNFINIERFKKSSITSVELRQGQINYSNAQTRLINAQFVSKIAEAEMLLLSGEIAE